MVQIPRRPPLRCGMRRWSSHGIGHPVAVRGQVRVQCATGHNGLRQVPRIRVHPPVARSVAVLPSKEEPSVGGHLKPGDVTDPDLAGVDCEQALKSGAICAPKDEFRRLVAAGSSSHRSGLSDPPAAAPRTLMYHQQSVRRAGECPSHRTNRRCWAEAGAAALRWDCLDAG